MPSATGAVVNSADSAPAELVETIVVDAQMMGQFVDDGHPDLVDEFVEIPGVVAECEPEQGDPIGQLEAAVLVALGAGNALVEAEQVLGLVLVFDQDHDVVEQVEDLVGQAVEGVADVLLELFDTDRVHASAG